MALSGVTGAAERIHGVVRPTPLAVAASLSRATGVNAFIKLENLQLTGSFKLRGAANAVLAARELGGAAVAGLAAVSTGNHGRAVAHMARALGLPVAVFVSERVPPDKLAALRALGADLQVGGDSQDEAEAAAVAAAAEHGLELVHPFDDEDVIFGQSTVGYEIGLAARAAGADLDAVLVPLSGGGLVAGVALGLAAAGSRARVIGVAMRGGSAMAASLDAGEPVRVSEVPTLADSLQGGLGLHNRLTLRLVGELMHDLILVEEGAIARGMVFAYRHEGQLLEGAGAVAVAAVLADPGRFAGSTVALVASGGNVPVEKVRELASTVNL